MREVPNSGPLVLKGGGQLTPLTPPGYGPEYCAYFVVINVNTFGISTYVILKVYIST